jgi:hypothetical protein
MKKLLFLFIISLIVQFPTFSQSIVVVNRDDNHPNKYEALLLNSEGKVMRVMNKKNNEDVSDFSEGLWVLRGKKGGADGLFDLANFLDQTGKKLFANDINGFAWGFSDGWSLITQTNKDETESHYYIDRSGKIVFKSILNEVGSFYKGVTWKKSLPGTDDENLYGLINKKGEWILKPTYYEIKDFKNGVAQVMIAMSAVDGSSPQQYAYINTMAKIVDLFNFQKKYDQYGDFSEGVYMAGTKMVVNSFKEKIEFTAIDSTGKELFSKKYYSSEIGDYINLNNMVYKNGLCPTSDGYINTKGEVVIQFPNYIIADATAFNNGLASFKMIPKNGDGFTFKYVVINSKGKIIWQSVDNKLYKKFEIVNQYFSK